MNCISDSDVDLQALDTIELVERGDVDGADPVAAGQQHGDQMAAERTRGSGDCHDGHRLSPPYIRYHMTELSR